MRKDERTFKMKQQFMSLHNRGLSIKEIASRFNLHVGTIYSNLEDIAMKEGCSRESLLEVVHSTHLTYDRQFEPVPEVDMEAYREKFNALEKSAKELSMLMSKDISELGTEVEYANVDKQED